MSQGTIYYCNDTFWQSALVARFVFNAYKKFAIAIGKDKIKYRDNNTFPLFF